MQCAPKFLEEHVDVLVRSRNESRVLLALMTLHTFMMSTHEIISAKLSLSFAIRRVNFHHSLKICRGMNFHIIARNMRAAYPDALLREAAQQLTVSHFRAQVALSSRPQA